MSEKVWLQMPAGVERIDCPDGTVVYASARFHWKIRLDRDSVKHQAAMAAGAVEIEDPNEAS